jgi:hypothetical protein
MRLLATAQRLRKRQLTVFALQYLYDFPLGLLVRGLLALVTDVLEVLGAFAVRAALALSVASARALRFGGIVSWFGKCKTFVRGQTLKTAGYFIKRRLKSTVYERHAPVFDASRSNVYLCLCYLFSDA